MDRGPAGGLIRVKAGALRHPAVIALGAAALLAVLGMNVAAFVRGLASPWLLGSVLIAVGVLVAAREVLTAQEGALAAETELAAIVEWSEDAIVGKSLDSIIRS